MSKLVQGKWGFFNRGFIGLRAGKNKELSINRYNEPNVSLLLLQLVENMWEYSLRGFHLIESPRMIKALNRLPINYDIKHWYYQYQIL